MTRSLLWLVCGLVAGAGIVVALDATGRVHGDALIANATAAADPAILNADRFGVGALGRVEPASAVRRVGPPGTLTMNRVDRLLVNEGDDVPAGQLLAEFADAPIKDADVQKAEAAVAEAQAELARVHVGESAEVIVPGTTTRYTATVQRIGWLVRHAVEANTDPVAAVDARTLEVRLRLDQSGSRDLRHRINMQVQVALQP